MLLVLDYEDRVKSFSRMEAHEQNTLIHQATHLWSKRLVFKNMWTSNYMNICLLNIA
jgi:hypothetical protein